ncbi:MAG: hypothetical protein RLZZ318_1577 [Bacteroidota bacterium]
MKRIATFLLVLNALLINAQGVKLAPLGSRPMPSSEGSSKRAITDTIQLPFIEDFSYKGPFPTGKYWRDSQVYINDHFAISPPSYGVATFDNLSKKGKPYQALSGLTHNHCDSLTSNFINLKTYKNGSNTVLYTLSDSIYLSFFYQAQGLGDITDKSDSLVLKFKNQSGQWQTVWKVNGTKVGGFKQVMIGIKDNQYLIPNFQMRWINYAKSTGNMNQWHLDYIRLKSSRSAKDTLVKDVAINAVPVGPLLVYESLPYKHYQANIAANKASEHKVILHNNDSNAVNVQYKCEVRNMYNQVIQNYPLSASARNIKKFSDSSEAFSAFTTMDTLSGKNPYIKLKYTIVPLSSDIVPSIYNSIGNNNEYTKTLRFNNYLAYDDGSAEGGFGLDYGSLPAGPGYAAQRYTMFKTDTLRALSVFFNRSATDIQFKSFDFIIWKTISEPPASTTSNDVILKRITMPTAVYTDSLNGFTTIVLDTAIVLNQGVFYIGWQQNMNFMLNIGYDRNYKYLHQGGRNPNLFYNLNGYWENVSNTITGAVMIRPIIGEALPKQTQVEAQTLPIAIQIYPNPISQGQSLQFISKSSVNYCTIYDLTGKLMQSEQVMADQSLSLKALSPGMYMVNCTLNNGQVTTTKLIIQ